MRPVADQTAVCIRDVDKSHCLLCASDLPPNRERVLTIKREYLPLMEQMEPRETAFRGSVRVTPSIRRKANDPRLVAVTVWAADRLAALEKIRAQVWRIFGRVAFEVTWAAGTPLDDKPRAYPSPFAAVFPGRGPARV